MRALLLTLTLMTFAFSALAAELQDSRFTGRSPSALGLPSLEQRLQNIAPAAGPGVYLSAPPLEERREQQEIDEVLEFMLQSLGEPL